MSDVKKKRMFKCGTLIIEKNQDQHNVGMKIHKYHASTIEALKAIKQQNEDHNAYSNYAVWDW